MIENVKNIVPWTYVISDLDGEKFVGTFYEKELQKLNQEQFRIEKAVKRKVGKLYVKYNGFDILFNSWIKNIYIVKNIKL